MPNERSTQISDCSLLNCPDVLVVLAAVVSSCGLFGSQEPPSDAPSISGTITAIQWDRVEQAFASYPHILVEEIPAVDAGGKMFAGFRDAAIHMRTGSGPWQGGKLSDLTVGAHADVWTIGVELTSSPSMGQARDIAITKP